MSVTVVINSNGSNSSNTDWSPLTTATTQPPEAPAVWIPFAEPVPDYEEAIEKWGIWWYVHIYGVGILFFTVAIFTFINIIALAMAKNMPQKAYFISLNAIIWVFSTERGIFMFVDAYNISGTLPPPVAYLFLSVGLPCMTSSFYLIFVAWMKATKMQRTNAVHKTKTMVIIILVHFTASLAFDLGAGFSIHAVYLLVCCQSLFIIMGVVLTVMYFYLYIRIYFTTVKTRKKLVKMSIRSANNVYHNSAVNTYSAHQSNFTADNKDYLNNRRHSAIPEAKIPLGAKLILATAILLLVIVCLYLVGIFFCYTLQVIAGDSPEPWSWWAYELSVRLCEIALCCTVSLAATRPITKRLAKEVSVRVRNSKRKIVDRVSKSKSIPKEQTLEETFSSI